MADMFTIPLKLSQERDADLYQFLDRLTTYRRRWGRGRTMEAQQVRDYCEDERERVKEELRRRGLPATRPDDGRVYGPGQAGWQRAGTQN